MPDFENLLFILFAAYFWDMCKIVLHVSVILKIIVFGTSNLFYNSLTRRFVVVTWKIINFLTISKILLLFF